MAINYSHLRSLTARELISALARDGFVLDRQAGSHQLYLHRDGRRVTLAERTGARRRRRQREQSEREERVQGKETAGCVPLGLRLSESTRAGGKPLIRVEVGKAG